MRFSYLSLSFLVMLGCSEDSDFHSAYNVPDDLQPFIDTFISEASTRGFVFRIENLIIKYDESLVSPYCGQCNSYILNTPIQKVITINPNIVCWYSDEEQEAFLFHELGHCFLGRLHDNALLPNGDAKSLMTENNLGVYAPCLYPIGDEICNNTFKRPYYLDELFDETVAVPEWGK